jgi:cell division protein FtsW
VRISRADRSRLAEWWFTVDHVLLAAILMIVGAGLILSLAASPAVALKKGFDAYHFVERHVLFAGLGVAIMVTVSLLSPAGVRRLALVLVILSLALLLFVQFAGVEINGAKRWLTFAGYSFQPSEIAKPGFAVLAAWLFAEAHTRPDMPAFSLAVLLLAVFGTLLILQPDVGQTILLVAVWATLYFASGRPIAGAAAIGAIGAAAAVAAYLLLPHVQARVDRWILNPMPGDRSQMDRAMQSFSEGGFLGRGPGEGTIKTVLPDAHTDFIYAVVAEEYGVIACLALLSLFAFVVLRALIQATREPEAATRLAIIGLSLLFGLQALINMGVNVGLLPAKGMTLPFISAGGSSTLAVSVTLGMLLAMTRRRPDQQRLKKPRLVPTIGAA